MLKTVTVLYYSLRDLKKIHAVVLHNLSMGRGGRVKLPDGFRDDKLLVAVLDGKTTVLDAMGDRYDSLPVAANG